MLSTSFASRTESGPSADCFGTGFAYWSRKTELVKNNNVRYKTKVNVGVLHKTAWCSTVRCHQTQQQPQHRQCPLRATKLRPTIPSSGSSDDILQQNGSLATDSWTPFSCLLCSVRPIRKIHCHGINRT